MTVSVIGIRIAAHDYLPGQLDKGCSGDRLGGGKVFTIRFHPFHRLHSHVLGAGISGFFIDHEFAGGKGEQVGRRRGLMGGRRRHGIPKAGEVGHSVKIGLGVPLQGIKA